MKHKRIKQIVKCDSCGGDGLYKRRTSYTVKGKPICFRCEGTGKVKITIPSYVRLYRVRTGVGPKSPVKLVPAAERKNYPIIIDRQGMRKPKKTKTKRNRRLGNPILNCKVRSNKMSVPLLHPDEDGKSRPYAITINLVSINKMKTISGRGLTEDDAAYWERRTLEVLPGAKVTIVDQDSDNEVSR